jgi:hypothetical protein
MRAVAVLQFFDVGRLVANLSAHIASPHFGHLFQRLTESGFFLKMNKRKPNGT